MRRTALNKIWLLLHEHWMLCHHFHLNCNITWWTSKRYASWVICWRRVWSTRFPYSWDMSYTSFQTLNMCQMCTFQFMCLLGFLGISHSVIPGGFMYFGWVLPSCGESPVLFHTMGQDWPVSQVAWKQVCNTGYMHVKLGTFFRSPGLGQKWKHLCYPDSGLRMRCLPMKWTIAPNGRDIGLSDGKLLFWSFQIKGSYLNCSFPFLALRPRMWY